MDNKYKSTLTEIFGTYEALPLDKQDLLERYVKDVWNEAQKELAERLISRCNKNLVNGRGSQVTKWDIEKEVNL